MYDNNPFREALSEGYNKQLKADMEHHAHQIVNDIAPDVEDAYHSQPASWGGDLHSTMSDATADRLHDHFSRHPSYKTGLARHVAKNVVSQYYPAKRSKADYRERLRDEKKADRARERRRHPHDLPVRPKLPPKPKEPAYDQAGFKTKLGHGRTVYAGKSSYGKAKYAVSEETKYNLKVHQVNFPIHLEHPQTKRRIEVTMDGKDMVFKNHKGEEEHRQPPHEKGVGYQFMKGKQAKHSHYGVVHQDESKPKSTAKLSVAGGNKDRKFTPGERPKLSVVKEEAKIRFGMSDDPQSIAHMIGAAQKIAKAHGVTARHFKRNKVSGKGIVLTHQFEGDPTHTSRAAAHLKQIVHSVKM